MKHKYLGNPADAHNLRPYFAVLVPSAQNGGKKSMQTICETFRPLVISQITRLEFAPLHEDAENIAYCEIVRCVNIYNGESYSQFAGFVKKMVHCALFNALRKEITHSSREVRPGNDILENMPTAMKEDEIIDNLMETAALAQLPAHYQRLLTAIYQQGLSVGEIAQYLGISHQAVSKMKNHALKQLRQLLQ